MRNVGRLGFQCRHPGRELLVDDYAENGGERAGD
jgi:hypothetical protein